MKRQTTKILGISVDTASKTELIASLDEMIIEKKPSLICTPNAEFIIKAQRDEEFAKILNDKSALNLPDGIGLLWASTVLAWKTPQNILEKSAFIIRWFFSLFLIPLFPHLLTRVIPEKISGSDFVWDLARFSASKNLRLFLLGGAPTVAERAALTLQTEIIGLRVAGISSGTPAETNKILEAIKKSRADILLVCFGAPKQEKWLAENLVKTGCKIGVGLGGTFDFLAGTRQRAPKFIQKIGLEWLFRLIWEPTRFRRQLAIPELIWRVLMTKIMNHEV